VNSGRASRALAASYGFRNRRCRLNRADIRSRRAAAAMPARSIVTRGSGRRLCAAARLAAPAWGSCFPPLSWRRREHLGRGGPSATRSDSLRLDGDYLRPHAPDQGRAVSATGNSPCTSACHAPPRLRPLGFWPRHDGGAGARRRAKSSPDRSS